MPTSDGRVSRGSPRPTGQQAVIEAPTAPRPRRLLRRGLGCLGAIIVVALAAFTAIGGSELIASLRGPLTPFDPAAVPPPPDYARPAAWLALPGRNG